MVVNIYPDGYIPPNRQLESPYRHGLFGCMETETIVYESQKNNLWKFQDFIDFIESIKKQTPLTYGDYERDTKTTILKRFEQ